MWELNPWPSKSDSPRQGGMWAGKDSQSPQVTHHDRSSKNSGSLYVIITGTAELEQHTQEEVYLQKIKWTTSRFRICSILATRFSVFNCNALEWFTLIISCTKNFSKMVAFPFKFHFLYAYLSFLLVILIVF